MYEGYSGPNLMLTYVLKNLRPESIIICIIIKDEYLFLIGEVVADKVFIRGI